MKSAIMETIQKIDLNSLTHIRDKKNRIISLRSNMILIIGIIASAFLTYYTWYLGWFLSILITVVAFIIIILILFNFFINPHAEEFEKKYTDNAINKILEELEFNVNWTSKLKLSKREFKKSKLFPTNFNSLENGRILKGKFNNHPYLFSQIEIKYKRKGRGAMLPDMTIFKGFYFRFDFDFDQYFILDVVKDESLGIDFFQKINFARPTLVKVDHLIFEEKYAVYSNNIEFTRAFLSSAFIKDILKLNDILETTIYFSIRMGSLHVAAPNEYDKLFQIDRTREIGDMAIDHVNETYNINNITKQIYTLFVSHLEEYLDT
jgi:hypothetical protein